MRELCNEASAPRFTLGQTNHFGDSATARMRT